MPENQIPQPIVSLSMVVGKAGLRARETWASE